MSHMDEIEAAYAHREAVDALTRDAWLCSPEAVAAAHRAMRMAQRGEAAFTLDMSRHGAEARVRQVRERIAANAAPFDPEGQA